MRVTELSHPEVVRARREIEIDNGGHLIGTVYPGEKIDLEAFEVPLAWESLLKPAELGLFALRMASPEDWKIFLIGDEVAATAIEHRRGDLGEARKLLDDWFNGFDDEA